MNNILLFINPNLNFNFLCNFFYFYLFYYQIWSNALGNPDFISTYLRVYSIALSENWDIPFPLPYSSHRNTPLYNWNPLSPPPGHVSLYRRFCKNFGNVFLCVCKTALWQKWLHVASSTYNNNETPGSITSVRGLGKKNQTDQHSQYVNCKIHTVQKQGRESILQAMCTVIAKIHRITEKIPLFF